MKEGLLWYDDSGQDLDEKVGRAAQRYRKKFGAAPDACYVHPSALNGTSKMKEVSGVRVMVLPSMLRHHFWLGQEEKSQRRKAVR